MILSHFVSEDFTATKSYVNNKFKVKVNEDDREYTFLNPHDFLCIQIIELHTRLNISQKDPLNSIIKVCTKILLKN